MSTNTVEVVEVPLASHIRLAAFSISNPRLWFAQAEAHFCSHQIQSQKVMYSYIVTTLPMDIAEEVSDLILEAPKENPYDTLKEALISRTGVSDQRRLDELFGNIEIGDRSPSQFLRHMKKLLGNRQLDDEIIRQLWMKRLPVRIREVLAVFGPVSLDELALAADKMLEANPNPQQLSACSNPDHFLPHADDVNTRLGNLEQQLQQLLNISRSRSTSRNSSRSRSRSRSHSRSRRPPRITNGNPSHCWYHQQFGNQARKCTPPCSFTNQGNPQAGQ